MNTITLDYSDYMVLIEGYTMGKSMQLDLEYLLNIAEYDKYDDDIRVREDDLRLIIKKYLKDKYDSKLAYLKVENDNKEA